MNKNKCNFIIKAKGLTRTFENGRVKALNGVDLQIKYGEFVSIMGPSGSGKSTMLNLLGALDRQTNGELFIDNHNMNDIKNLTKFRSEKIGFIFQLHNLIPSLTSLENVLVPTFSVKGSYKEKKNRAEKLLKHMGLGERMNFLPTKMSGGERQRVAIARALMNKPKIILADEPTGDVDSKNGEKIMDFLQDINKKQGTTLIVVTHDPAVGERAGRKLRMLDGKIMSNNS